MRKQKPGYRKAFKNMPRQEKDAVKNELKIRLKQSKKNKDHV